MPKIIPIENIEDIRNKVTSLEGELTDEQYPSAKAVSDALTNMTPGDIDLSSKQDKIADVSVEENTNKYILSTPNGVVWSTDKGFSITNNSDLYDISLLDASRSGVSLGYKDSPYQVSEYGIHKLGEGGGSAVTTGESESRLTSNYHGLIVTNNILNCLSDTYYSNIIIDKNHENIRLHSSTIIIGKYSDLTGRENVPGIIANVAEPENDDEVANKKYVDKIFSDIIDYPTKCGESKFEYDLDGNKNTIEPIKGKATWYYEKWKSGKAVCWCTVNMKLGLKNKWQSESAHYYADIDELYFPEGLFKEAPKVWVNSEDYNGSTFMTKGMSSTSNTGKMYCVSPSYIESIDVNIHIEAKGKWK